VDHESRTVLVTGGAGYIGSHTCVELAAAGWQPVVVDDLSNGSAVAVERAAALAGVAIPLHVVDLLDEPALDAVIAAVRPVATLHFAGLKAVGESVREPLRYHHVNVGGTLNLLRALDRHGRRDLVFSSSATVYGEPERLPLTEDHPLRATNPYGQTKLTIEWMLRDLAAAPARAAEAPWRLIALRYFNPVGAHPSGRIGEDPHGPPNNLAPFITQVAIGRRASLGMFGDDWPTPDGTGVRDYIHVVDLAQGHVAALAALPRVLARGGYRPINLGTGRGTSVRELLAAMEQASGRPIPHHVAPRRAGDIASCWADPTLAAQLLDFRATRGIEAMCADAWRWQQDNPDGYPAATPPHA
jgi:UDP-glucose 4-epimerase